MWADKRCSRDWVLSWSEHSHLWIRFETVRVGGDGEWGVCARRTRSRARVHLRIAYGHGWVCTVCGVPVSRRDAWSFSASLLTVHGGLRRCR